MKVGGKEFQRKSQLNSVIRYAPPIAALLAGMTLGKAVSAAEPEGPPIKPASAACDPYTDYDCLESHLGTGFFERLKNYYLLEWGKDGAPVDPKAPASRREDWPAAPVTAPPMPFTEWPYGGTTPLGVTRPASVDSPLMTALAPTGIGQWLTANNFQLYGWVDVGANLSTSSQKHGGNAPAAYVYYPNSVTLDQAVLYLDRFPDTVQKDHLDWGMRLSAIYGTNYRYTTAYGVVSEQLLNRNKINGYDFPMFYGEVYVPYVLEGLMLRAGRFISLPDIEAQLAPNNYMYTHSMTYSFDNYTNTGIQSSLAVTKNWIAQLGLTAGTEASLTHLHAKLDNPYPNVAGTGPGQVGYNPIYPDATFKKDPGSMPSWTACVRWNSDSGRTDINACADAINRGTYGYNNLQWYGLTAYQKFDDHWHVSFEAYKLFQRNVPNSLNSDVQAVYAAGGAPFSSRFIPFNAPNLAICGDATVVRCTAKAYGTVAYINYSPDSMNNVSLRPEFYWDPQGQRTGAATRYGNMALGLQHWFSPQVEVRPEIAYYHSFNAPAFNGDANAGKAPNKRNETILSGDVIFHF